MINGISQRFVLYADGADRDFTIRRLDHDEADRKHALWLMRLSYLRYALKADADPRKLLKKESKEMRLSPEFESLLERFVARTPDGASTAPLPA